MCGDGDWTPGELRIKDALEGTSIAAVAYDSKNSRNQIETQLRVYYQTEDLSLSEQCHNSSGWFKGKWIFSE